MFFGVGDKPRNAQRKNKVSKKLFKSMNIYIYYIIYIYIYIMVSWYFNSQGKEISNAKLDLAIRTAHNEAIVKLHPRKCINKWWVFYCHVSFRGVLQANSKFQVFKIVQAREHLPPMMKILLKSRCLAVIGQISIIQR